MTAGHEPDLVDPVADRHTTHALASRRRPDGDIRVGLIDATLNKASLWGQGMLDAAEARLGALMPLATYVREQLNPLDNPPVDRWAEATAGRFDIAVFSAGDCVTCTTRAVRSAIGLERAGVPSAVVCTAAMTDVVAAVCHGYGMPALASFPVRRSLFGAGREAIADTTAEAVADLPRALLAESAEDAVGSV